MQFRTTLNVVPSTNKIDYRSKILMLGSCFTNNIGQKLEDACFDICINPFGTLYNPYSILNSLEILLNGGLMNSDELFSMNNLFHSFHFHGSFSNNDRTLALQRMNESITLGHHFLQQTDFLFITFGTSYVYENKYNKQIVSNCHKLPASAFSRYRTDLAEMTKKWDELLVKLHSLYPHMHVIFTVSPIRHIADGLHENQISKAQLLLLTDILCSQNENASYFPAYEVMMDDLRDYRFYTEDMVHPSNVAILYIWELFQNSYIDLSAIAILSKIMKLYKSANHRPFNVQDRNYKLFLEQTLAELNGLVQKYPYLSTKKLQDILENKLNH